MRAFSGTSFASDDSEVSFFDVMSDGAADPPASTTFRCSAAGDGRDGGREWCLDDQGTSMCSLTASKAADTHRSVRSTIKIRYVMLGR